MKTRDKKTRKDNYGASVREILPAVFKSLGIDGRLEEGQLVREWPSIVGKDLAKRSGLRDVRNGILFIEAENNIWMQEIRFLQKRIIGRIKSRFPELTITGVRLFIKREKGEE
jgi:predicted nucleic acid-binding Zn ribbon protein